MNTYYEIDTERLEVGQETRFSLTVTIGSEGLPEGGALRVEFPWGCWTPPVMAEIKVHAYLQHANADVSAVAKNTGVEVTPRVWYRGVLNPFVTISVSGGPLEAGDTVLFRYGLSSDYLPPARCQTYPSDSAEFVVRMNPDPSGRGEWIGIEQRGNLAITAGPPERLELVLPSLMVLGGGAPLRHVLTDRHRNEPRGTNLSAANPSERGVSAEADRLIGRLHHSVFEGDVRIDREDDGGIRVVPGVSGTVRIGADDDPADEDFRRDSGEDHRTGLLSAAESAIPLLFSTNLDYLPLPRRQGKDLTIPEVDLPEEWRRMTKQFAGVSNPCRVVESSPGYSIYWGDLHIHTDFSDGRLPIDAAYRYARDITRLDIAAAADHESGIEVVRRSGGNTRDACMHKWRRTQETADEFYRPGEFVTLRGFEWTSNGFGHRNVYFPGGGVDDLLAGLDNEYLHYEMKPDHFYEIVEDPEALIIPHHTLVSTDWSYYDPRELLVEIYSTWGRTEYPGNQGWDKPVHPGGGILTGLERGYRFGLIGGSDAHDSRGGRCYPSPPARNLNYRSGLMAVLAEELTRESVYRALSERRVYATSGERIYLNVLADGSLMGSELERPAGSSVEYLFEAAGTRPIRSVSFIGERGVIEERTLEAEWVEHSLSIRVPPAGETRFVYVRLEQCDGNFAWSSPVWITGV